MQKHRLGLVLFRRDLRLVDHTALRAAAAQCERVVGVFTFNPRQVDAEHNEYFGVPGMTFLLESLAELSAEMATQGSALVLRWGEPLEEIAALVEETGAGGVYYNRDYTPFARRRDAALNRWCLEKGIAVEAHDDALLVKPEAVKTGGGTPYTVFTPFWKKARGVPVDDPVDQGRDQLLPLSEMNQSWSTVTLDEVVARTLGEMPTHYRLRGGRSRALERLERAVGLTNYAAERDIPALAGTSTLSADHKYGTVSVRETYWRVVAGLGPESTLLQELYWRDFFHHIAWHWPHVFGGAYRSVWEGLEWSDDVTRYERWRKGETGYPIVDAGMRELNETGYMHNRVRMIVATFLVKHLRVDWRWGERYFAQKLTDYDPCVNNGNWQWAASTGCDAQPYFRIFNPWRQQERFDPDGVYVRRWVQELGESDAVTIKKWEQHSPPETLEVVDERCPETGYPYPMVNHKAVTVATKAHYKAVKGG